VKTVRGWAFPESDEFMVAEQRPDLSYQLGNLTAALRHVTNHDAAIDGGAHTGTWSKVMSGHFSRVIAIEPSRDTFECLTSNMERFGCVNVECKNVALGAAPGFVEMALTAEQAARANTGARYARTGGTIPVETIDSWHLPSLGFLKLDIEGSEFVALQGAAATIDRCKPVVLFERKFLWTRYFGLPKNVVEVFLKAHSYGLAEAISCDQIWVPN